MIKTYLEKISKRFRGGIAKPFIVPVLTDAFEAGQLCLKKLSELPEQVFRHDMEGIMKHWRDGEMKDGFLPRSYISDMEKERRFEEAAEHATLGELQDLADYYGFTWNEERGREFITVVFRNGTEVVEKIKTYYEEETPCL